LVDACTRGARAQLQLSAGARRWLENHAWPGNIRELKNVIERAVLLCEGTEITVDELPATGLRAPADVPDEARHIADVLAACGGNQTLAAKQLGMSRRTLVHRLNQYGLPRPKKR